MRVDIRLTFVGVMCIILLSACASATPQAQAGGAMSGGDARPAPGPYRFIEFYSPL